MRRLRNTKPPTIKRRALLNSNKLIRELKTEEDVLIKIKKLYSLAATFLLVLITSIASAQTKVVAYVPNWINLNTYVNQIDYAKITHINIAFENPVNSSGGLSFNSANNVLINKAHENNVKILMSIGGGAASGDQTLLNRYFDLMSSAKRAAFAAKLANYVVSHNLDGLDIDIEGPSINGDYGAFVAEVSAALKAKGKLCTAALSQGYGGDKVPNSVFQHFDFINIMAYDGRGYWDPNTPGQHSSLDFAKSNTMYWINRGLPRAKAVLGVPFYGYGFGAAFRNRDYSYKEIIAAYPDAENVDQVGSTIWYNGIPTIKAKTNYAFDQSIGGIMIWSLDYDGTGSKSLLTAIDQVVKARTVVVPQGPYNNTRVSLPGKIEAENYDVGGQNVAYNDLSANNEGTVYRTDGVDVQATTDAGGGYNIGWISDGEWLEYSVNVTATGPYNLNFRTASGAGALRMEVDGIDATGTVNLPNTGAYQTWATTTKSNVTLTAGNHVIRIYIITGGFNLNYVTVSTPVNTNGPGYLHADGKNIVNKQGNFVIKAINLGNYMVQEGYMLNLGGGFQHVIKQKIADVVGTENRDKFYDDYYAHFVTKADIDSIAKWGFNSIRLPMHYNLFTPLGQQDVYIEKGFTMVDNILSWCKANNLYLILDLHAAPGGQNSGDISDYVAGQPSLWESQANRDQTVKLWRKFAERYANEEYIGGYDLINETNWTIPGNTLLATLMKNITTAIRQVDNNHILFIEGNSYANDYTGLTPKWDNNMAYSFHKYWNDNSAGSLNFVLAIRDGQNVPIWLGEFGENSNNWIANAITIMNQNNIGWAIWPYKKMSSVSCVSSFKQPANWSALSGYINGGAKPSQAAGQAILNELIENVKIQNCTFNKGYLRALFQQPGNNNTVPFSNVNLPGKIIAANYNEGKQGYAYSDVAFQNTQFGTTTGSSSSPNNGWYYRNDGVDLQFSTAENGPTIGWTENGEWLQYTVNVSVAGTYTVKARVAGNGGSLSLSADGSTVINGATIAATSGWEAWTTVTLGNINLTAGTHTLRATFTTAGFNLSYLDFSTQTIVRAPYSGTPALIPGKIEAENYDIGAQGQSYNDSESANQGNTYRTDGVDIQATTDASGGFNVGYTAAGEWLEYTVNVDSSMNYDVQFRIATTAVGKKVHIEKGSQNITGSVELPNTGAWQTWQTVTVKNIALVKGEQILRIVMETDGINLNHVTFVPSVLNQLPVVSITAPVTGTEFTAPASVVLEASATDNDGSISKVEFFNGATLLGSSTNSPYSFNWTNVAAGIYSITAKVTDNANGVSSSSVIVITVKNPTPTCLPASASSDDGNVASNVLDNNFSTRWSANGDGQWIQFCLDSVKAIGGVQIAFYNGTTRQSIFDIQVSSDGSAWSTILTNAHSSGSSDALETFGFPVQNTKYVRITGHGNNINTWNSFTEVKIVTGPVNQLPTVSITSPANNSSYNAPASISITANAADSDGTISKVEFFSGNSLIATDVTAPYSFTWTSVAAGDYTITAKVTDNSGASVTSSPVAVKVNTVVSNPCASISQYVENNGYVAGSKVQNAGKQYQCKPYPYSGWCNGAAWAYAPGTGTYWTDAWTLVGNCTSAKTAMISSEELISNAPNPFMDITTIDVTVAEGSDVSIKIYNKTGQVVATVFEGYLNPGTYSYNFDASYLKSDIYLIQYTTGSDMVTKRIVKSE